MVFISHRTRADVWENVQSGSLGGASLWRMRLRRRRVIDSITLRWPPYYTLYMTHLHCTRTRRLPRSYMSPRSCHEHTRAVQGKRFFLFFFCCSRKLSKHSCLWRPVSSAFTLYLASFKSSTHCILQRDWDWVGERREREKRKKCESVSLIWRLQERFHCRICFIFFLPIKKTLISITVPERRSRGALGFQVAIFAMSSVN